MEVPVTDVFRYEPLRSPDSIRLAVLPSNGKESKAVPIQLQLFEVKLSEARNKYTALSYTWGVSDAEQVPSHIILVNGRPFRVHDNLMYFLRRQRTKHKQFWIDAICINQNDLDEKAIQIPLMRQIFADAANVHAELGPGTAAQEQVIRELHKIEYFLSTAVEMAGTHEDGRTAYDNLRIPKELQLHENFWRTLDEILLHPWWTRVWVMQEISAAEPGSSWKVWLHLGSARTSLYSFRDVYRLHDVMFLRGTQLGQAQTVPDLHFSRFLRIDKIRSLRRDNPGNIELLVLLNFFRGLKATKGQDLLYSAMNMATDISFDTFKVDYRKLVSEVFEEVAIACLRNPDIGLDLLGYCSADSEIASTAETTGHHYASSWIPDWTKLNPRAIFPKRASYSDGLGVIRSYNASGHRPISSSVFKFDVRNSKLLVSGFYVDVINNLSATFSSSPRTSNHLSRGQAVSKWAPINQNEPYVAGGTAMEAFLRTIVADSQIVSSTGNKSAGRGAKAHWDYAKGELAVGPEQRAIKNACIFPHCRCLATTARGYIGLVHDFAREGDVIYALYGGSMLYILRPLRDEFIFIGECYVHGLMDGQAVDLFNRDGTSTREVTIV
jgi:hypothetical protein